MRNYCGDEDRETNLKSTQKIKYVTGITGSQLTAISNSIPHPQLTRKLEKPDILLLGFITAPNEPNLDSPGKEGGSGNACSLC